MTKEQVQARLTQIQTEKTQLQSALTAYDGAIQDCQYWLNQFDVPAETAVEETPAS